MPEYRIYGVDRDSAHETSLVVEATNNELAAKIGEAKGIDVFSCVAVNRHWVARITSHFADFLLAVAVIALSVFLLLWAAFSFELFAEASRLSDLIDKDTDALTISVLSILAKVRLNTAVMSALGLIFFILYLIGLTKSRRK